MALVHGAVLHKLSPGQSSTTLSTYCREYATQYRIPCRVLVLNRLVSVHHILLGLVLEGEGIAAGVLNSMGVRLEMVRRVTDEVVKDTEKEMWNISHRN